MITGTIVLEDQIINFQFIDDVYAQYEIADVLTGVSAVKILPFKEFSCALLLALGGEVNVDDLEDINKAAERAMLTAEELGSVSKQCPNKDVVQLLRWIP